MGGIPIKNPLIDGVNAVVLGAIVFDSTSGTAHGLSVHHGIGDGAQLEQPIHQPLKSDAKYRIGKLVVSDPEFDTALFELDSERSYLGKIKGLEEDFEPGQPKTLRKDMVVECYGRRTYAKGVIKQVLHRKTSNGYRLSKARIHLYPGFRTKGGDSGAVWVEEKSKCPIGLHCGSLKKNAYVDVAHSVVDIAKRFKFQFHPLAKSRVLAAELDPFETCFC